MIAQWYNSNRIHINIIKHGSAMRKSHDIVAIKHDTGIAENDGLVTNNKEVEQLRQQNEILCTCACIYVNPNNFHDTKTHGPP